MPKNHIKAILKSCYRSKDELDNYADLLQIYMPAEGNRNEMKNILKEFCGKSFNAEILEEYAEKILSVSMIGKEAKEEPKHKKFKYKEPEE